MRSIKCVFRIAFQNFRKWSEDYRLWIIALLVLILCIDNLRSMITVASELGNKASIWTYPFIYSQFYMKLVCSLPIILLFCNAPFVDSNKLLILTRSGATKYLIGQILYIVFASFVYYFYIMLCTIITALPFAELSADWGNAVYTLAYSNNAGWVAVQDEIHFLEVSGFVVQNFSPVSACLLTLLLSWLCGVMFGLIMLLCNLMSRNKYLGSVICGAIMALCAFAGNETMGLPAMMRYSPLSWITLDISGGKANPGFPDITYCVTVYLSVTAALAAAILFFGRSRILRMEAV